MPASEVMEFRRRRAEEMSEYLLENGKIEPMHKEDIKTEYYQGEDNKPMIIEVE